jgi:heme oxygenase
MSADISIVAPNSGSSAAPDQEDSLDPTTIRQALQAATNDVHERLHCHPGLAAVKDQTITRENYARLLGRLYGFYTAFEAAAGLAPTRSEWLKIDLTVLGVSPLQQSKLPLCSGLPDLATPEALLGALYVVEGSALGGIALARCLEGMVGEGNLDGRRFFSGRLAETGAAWRAYLQRLSAASGASKDRATMIFTANATFAAFERWLDGWNEPS